MNLEEQGVIGLVDLRGIYLTIPLLILSWTVMPTLGLENSSRGISSYGTVTYPEYEIGFWDVHSGAVISDEASWVFANYPDYGNANLLGYPDFEHGLLGWGISIPLDKPFYTEILPGYIGKSAVMVSDGMGNLGGVYQHFRNIPPNTTFHFSAMIKTVDVESLETRTLFWDIFVEEQWYGCGEWGVLRGSRDWASYEVSFTTPNRTTHVRFYPVLVHNRGQVWIDEASLTIEGWQPPRKVPTILNWFALHRPQFFTTEADLKFIEQGLKTIPTEKFWGIIFVEEEQYRAHVDFDDDVNTTWFGERLLGYPLYLAERPGTTIDQWKDEMFLRMIRGFYNYFSPLTKVGITVCGDSIVTNWKNQGWSKGIPFYFGEPAMTFIRENYDFIVLYAYTENLEEFTNWTKQYFQLIDQLFQKQKKFWILTQSWGSIETWEPEVIALEMKNCLDRNMVITPYYDTVPPLEEIWNLMLNAIELYDKAPYFENYVYGKNLLTGYIGNTYGWVED